MPRLKPLVTPACAASIYGVLPCLAPRVFAPWPKGLQRRDIRLYRSSPSWAGTQAKASAARKTVTLEDSEKLAAALGEGGGDGDIFSQWSTTKESSPDGWQETTERAEGAQGSEWATSYMSSADYWQPRPELKRRLDEAWAAADEKLSRQREQIDQPVGSGVFRPLPLYRIWHLRSPSNERANRLAAGEKHRMVQRNSRFRRVRDTAFRSVRDTAFRSVRDTAFRPLSLDKDWKIRAIFHKYAKRRIGEGRHRFWLSTLYRRIRLPRTAEEKEKLQKKRRYIGEKAFRALRERLYRHRNLKIAPRNPEDTLFYNSLDERLFQELKKSDGPRMSQIYNDIEAFEVTIRIFTRFQFVHHLARKGETNTALKALKTLHDLGLPFTEPLMMQQCATILQNKFRKELVPPTDFEIFEWMISLGLEPNPIFYNILIRNSSDRGDRESIYQIYKEMEENGIEPTDYTFSILLNDAKMCGDMESVRGIFQVASEKQVLNVYLVNDLLHSIYLIQREANKTSGTQHSPLKPMFDFYRQYFRSEDFLALIPPEHMPEQLADDSLIRYTPFKMNLASIHLLFMVLMQSLSTPQQVLHYYEHFQSLVQENHPVIRQLTKLDEFYDVFLMAFGRWEQSLGMCTDVLQSMLSPPSHVNIKPPTVRSWSILVKSFMSHRQPLAAEKVLKMMRDRGLEPTQITWHRLIGGYVALQDIQGALDAQERMEMHGFPSNTETESRLSWIRDQDALARMRMARLGGSGVNEEDEMGDFDGSNEPLKGTQ